MLLQSFTLLILPLGVFPLRSSRLDCICPPAPQCPPSSKPCADEKALDITDKRTVEKVRAGKVKLRKQSNVEQSPTVHVEGEAHSHIQKRSATQESMLPDDDSDLLAPGRKNRLDRRAMVQALPEDNRSALSSSVQKNDGEILDIKCNSHVLKKLMLENIGDNSSVSKRAINDRAEAKFGGNIDVICSKGHFSYVYSSNLYCEATKGDVTCIAFRQSH